MNNIEDKSLKPSKIKSEILSLLFIIVIGMSIRTFIMEIYYVPTGSMKATMLEGDYVFSTKYSYGYSNYSFPFSPNILQNRIFASKPTRGDVVIMRPPHNMEERYVKRLIGLPGDKIEIKDNLIYINDKPIKRTELGQYNDESGTSFIKFLEELPDGASYFSYKMKYPNFPIGVDHDNFGPIIIENDHYFLLGDNRDGSGDSRYQLKNVPFKYFIAKGRFVIFSTKIALWDLSDGIIAQITRFGSWIKSIRFNRISQSLYE